MLVKFFRKSGRSPITQMYNYLLGKDNDREYARVLTGDVQLSKDIIHQMDFTNRYTAGCLSFEEENIPEHQKFELMQDFEKSLLNGLDASQYNIVWIEHRDKRRLELNFVIANQELTTGKRLQPYYDGVDRPLVENWKLVKNAEYGFSEPKDPSKLNAVSDPKRIPKTAKEVRDKATDLVLEAHEKGKLKSRNDVVKLLESKGYVIKRESQKSLSIENPLNPEGQNIRLPGQLFHDDYNSVLNNETKQKKHAENLANAQDKLTYALQVKQEFNQQKYGHQSIPDNDLIEQLLEDYDYDADKRISVPVLLDHETVERLDHEISNSNSELRSRKQIAHSTEQLIESVSRNIDNSEQAIERSEQTIERIPELFKLKLEQAKADFEDLTLKFGNYETSYYKRLNIKNENLAKLEDRYELSQKWLRKNKTTEENLYEYRQRLGIELYKRPDYFLPSFTYENAKKDEELSFQKDIAELANKSNIQNVVQNMWSKAAYLESVGEVIEPYALTPTQKIKSWFGVKVERTILDDLSDFETNINPMINAYNNTKSEKARKDFEEWQKQEAKKEADRKKAADLEKKRAENAKRLELERIERSNRPQPEPSPEPQPQKSTPNTPKRDDSFDYGM